MKTRFLTATALVLIILGGFLALVVPAPLATSADAAPSRALPARTPGLSLGGVYLPLIQSGQPARLDTTTVYFLDVGQGDSTLLVGPDFTILIDAGRHDRNDVVPHLEAIGIEAIDLLIGTHPHADHIGQFPQVLARYPVTEVWMSGEPHASLTFERALDAILASNAAYHEPRAHEAVQVGSAVVDVLNPASLSGDLHASMVAVRVRFGDVALLFTGDAEAATEQAMIDRGHTLAAQVLQLGHHGSDTSTSASFLHAVAPQLAVWSAAANNSYGHPHAPVLNRLANAGVKVCGTAVHGTIAVRTDGRDFTVLTDSCASGNPPPATPSAPTATPVPTATPPPPTATPQLTPTVTAPTCVNINTASFEELQLIVHIGPERALDLIAKRPFSSVDDMVRINGIGPARLQDIKAQGLACV